MTLRYTILRYQVLESLALNKSPYFHSIKSQVNRALNSLYLAGLVDANDKPTANGNEWLATWLDKHKAETTKGGAA